MWNYESSVLGMGLALGLLASCVPTAARKNAKLKAGFDVDLSAGVQVVGEGEQRSDGSVREAKSLAHVEADIQYAHTFDDGSGLAMQLKVPLTIVFTSVDLYYQLPDSVPKWHYGFGVELGALRGLYFVVTHYLSNDFYISLTPRVLLGESVSTKHVLINPQLSLGVDNQLDVSVFLGAAYHTGEGFDFEVDLFSDENRTDYRKKFFLAGVSMRF